jgi:tetratricopeptide (TPR) repeat protein/tRNA A-37 threonylcarbamoyl transferase component Bud32
MKLDCRRCGTAIPIPPEATISPEATLVCPGCGARYARRGRSATATASMGSPLTAVPTTAAAPPAGPVTKLPGDVSAISHPTVAMPSGDATRFRPGDAVAGRYRVRRFIARGGMGEVYEAEDAELRQVVALKTVHPREARHELAVERFKREIHLARRVTHPNVCRIYDVGYHPTVDGEAVIFLSMELLEGETLAERIKRTGALSTAEALPLARQMMDALVAAHAVGVVHRDFKSENVFLVRAGDATRVVVTDFGVARGMESDEFAARVTVADAAVGTPAYMAPEQIEGAEITPAIDQYALGVVLFEMVTGCLPFAGETPIATAVKRLTHAAPSADEFRPGLDPRWVTLIRRCLARRPEERFDSVREAREALDSGEPVEGPATTVSSLPAVPAPPAPTATSPPRRRQKALLAVVGVLFLLAAASAVVRVRRSLQSPLAGLAAEERRAVAVVPFRNLAQREEFEWLSVALAEMVASEVRTARGLRTVSGDAVARAGVDLELAQLEALDAATLDRLRGRLGADFVVAGTFTALGSGSGTTFRVAVRLDDARRRETVGETVETGSETQLFELVARLGERLRTQLGEVKDRRAAGGGAAAPRNPRAARLYSEGLMKLRQFEPQAALERLEQARDAEPANPLIRAALASTWAALGFEAKSAEEAAFALRQGEAMPPEDRFAVEALASELRRDWPAAGETWGKLWQAFPDNLDYGLRLARAQIESGQTSAALATLAALRELPEPDGESPRIDLAEAAAALAASDFARQLEAAQRAVEKGGALGAPLVAAEARVRAAEALRKLGKPLEAEAESEAARALYRAAGDRIGEAAALTVTAGALFDRGDLAASREANEHALGSYREAGDRNGVARTLNGLAVLARNLGEPEKSRALYAEAIAVLTEIDDRRGLAYTRNNLAAVSAEEGRLAEARQTVDEALEVFRELGDRVGAADALLNLGVVERQLGALDAARTRVDESLAMKRELGLRPGEAAAQVALGEIARDRGALAEGSRNLEEAVRLATAADSRAILSNALAGQGEIAIERADFAGAKDLLTGALALRTELGRAGKIDEARALLARSALEAGEPRSALAVLAELASAHREFRAPQLATSIALLEARALAAQGRVPEARAAMLRADELAARSESAQTSLEATAASLTLELAGVGRANPRDAAAVERDVTVARQRGFEPLALELEILAARRALNSGETDARQDLERIAAACEAKSLLRLSRMAQGAATGGN